MIHFIFYNPEQQRLRLQFDGGEVYDYYLVTPDRGREAEVHLAGGDHGYFRKFIRGVYPFHRRK